MTPPVRPVRPVRLVPVDRAGARLIADGGCVAGLRPAVDYPDEGDQVAAGMVLHYWDAVGDPSPFGIFVIAVPEPAGELTAVGGIGFHGPPGSDGAVEIGYCVTPTQRRQGIAGAAVAALIGVARQYGVGRLIAETEAGNAASVSVLVTNGFRAVTIRQFHASEQLTGDSRRRFERVLS